MRSSKITKTISESDKERLEDQDGEPMFQAIRDGDIEYLDACWDYLSSDGGFPGYDILFRYALEHANPKMFLHVVKGWCFAYEERDESTSYEEALTLADKNKTHGNKLKTILTQVLDRLENYPCAELEDIEDMRAGQPKWTKIVGNSVQTYEEHKAFFEDLASRYNC
jgi:hypothetical protein